jgi:nickel/cobalt transporter (NicO) family protein
MLTCFRFYGSCVNELQSWFYQLLSKHLIALKAGDNAAVFAFLTAAFLYGVLHAAGPGHGKAVISSYLLATGDSLKRGLKLAWLSSLCQGITALIFTGIAIFLLGATSKMMQTGLAALDFIFAISMLLIGLRLLHRAFVKNQNCLHIPPAEQLLVRDWREDVALIGTIAIRPCTGAIFIAVFAFSQGLWLYGVLAVSMIALGTAITVSILAIIAAYMKKFAVKLAENGSNKALILMKTLEIIAASLLILFAGLLLSGILSIEKMGAFR